MKNQLLEINLSTGKTKSRELEKKEIKKWLGGRGLGAHLLHEEIKQKPNIEPLSEHNPVIISTSPLTGYLPSANRTWITTISPLTNFYTTSSGGGHFAGEMKKKGYIAIKITGKSKKPIHIEIDEEGSKIKDGEKYWGKKVYELAKETREKGYEPLSIGPAAEKGVKYASTSPGVRSCSRGGTGTVLGYKKLKAILIKKAEEPEVPKELENIIKKKFQEIAKERQPREKTLPLVGKINSIDSYPTDNWKKSHFPNAEKETGLPALKKYITKTKSCYKCPIGCQDIMQSKYTGEGDGVEYEIAWAFGANLMNTNEEIIVAANHLCDQYGIDVLNTAGAIAWAKEASEKKMIDYEWKGPKSILELVKKIGERKGIGKILGEGSRKTQEKYGGNFSSDIRGMNLPAYDPRGLRGMSLTYSQGPRYGCHLKAWTVMKEVNNSEENTSPREKPLMAYEKMVERAVTDSTSICSFVSSYTIEDYAEIYSKILDGEVTPEQLRKRGHEIQKLEREIDKLRGIKKENDKLPHRVLNESVEVKGKETRIGEKQLKEMNEELYKYREI